jgi:hypothetical protein
LSFLPLIWDRSTTLPDTTGDELTGNANQRVAWLVARSMEAAIGDPAASSDAIDNELHRRALGCAQFGPRIDDLLKIGRKLPPNLPPSWRDRLISPGK